MVTELIENALIEWQMYRIQLVDGERIHVQKTCRNPLPVNREKSGRFFPFNSLWSIDKARHCNFLLVFSSLLWRKKIYK